MANDSDHLGAIVSNTDPALIPGPEPLTGQHVTLTRLTTHHFPDLYENVVRHKELWTWWPEGPFDTYTDFNNWLSGHLNDDKLIAYAVILSSGPHQDKAVGCAFALPRKRPVDRVVELGILFGPLLQRTTAATEVVFLMCCSLFDVCNYRRLEWTCNTLNVSSRKAAERYGFVLEGVFRQDKIVRGRNRDSCWYSMIDSEWLVSRKVFEMWLDDANFDGQKRQRRRMEEIRENLMKI